MNKLFLKYLELKGYKQADFEGMEAEKQAEIERDYLSHLEEKMENLATNESVKEQIKGLATSEQIKKLEEMINELKDANVGSNDKPLSMFESIKSELVKNKDLIAQMKTNSNSTAQITIKAVQAMTFATNTTGAVGRTERVSGFQDTFRRNPILLEIVDTTSTNAKTVEWVEKTGREGGVAMTAECGLKPQGDWDLSLHSQSAKKEAIIVTISKEMLDDIDGMARDVEQEINEQLRLFMESQVMNGDNTGNNIIGVDENAVPFVAGTFADTVVNPNTADTIRVAINQIELTNDFPTGILMHPSDATAMELEKDPTTSQYILPPFTTAGGTSVKGLPIRTSPLVTQGNLYVGNFKRFKVKMREDITFEMGHRGAQGDWEKNMVSFLGEARFFGFIPAVHYASIVKVDIEVAKGLLLKP